MSPGGDSFHPGRAFEKPRRISYSREAMTKPLDWLNRIFSSGRVGMQLVTPPIIPERSPLLGALVGGATVGGILACALLGALSFAALLFAIASVYFLSTQVLGLKVNIDPQAFYETMQRQAAAYGAN